MTVYVYDYGEEYVYDEYTVIRYYQADSFLVELEGGFDEMPWAQVNDTYRIGMAIEHLGKRVEESDAIVEVPQLRVEEGQMHCNAIIASNEHALYEYLGV